MMEAKALEAEARIDSALSKEEALQNAIAAADIYMKAIKLSSNEAERTRLKRKCMGLLSKAESIKSNTDWSKPLSTAEVMNKKQKVSKALVSTRKLSTREEIILLESSRLHGSVFPRWTRDPPDDFFDGIQGVEHFHEASDMMLSETQQSILAGWKRPSEVWRVHSGQEDGKWTLVYPTMIPQDEIDLVQDVTTDCSVVASLCAAIAQSEGRFSKLLSSVMFPYDSKSGHPKLSNNGKYIFRFQFNGCSREVTIDDRLPTSTSSRSLYVIDRRNPGLLWPALLEKAYLKVRGGYDFPGSNSGTDLWILTGWIPEQIFLQSDELCPGGLWNRIHKAYRFGDVIITLGTGKLSSNEEEGLGLAGEHDYAVLAIKEVNDSKMLLVKNPWCDGSVWKESKSVPASNALTGTWTQELQDALPATNSPSLGTFWMSFDGVVRNFESMYLNWNPALFLHRSDYHFSWDIRQKSPPDCLLYNPQYSIESCQGETVWILLSRHLSTEEHNISKRTGRNPHRNSSPLGYISIYVFDANGQRVYVSDNALQRGPFVDSPQTLARIDIPETSSYTIVAVQQGLPLPSYSFTLSTYSREVVKVEMAKSRYAYQQSLSSAWKQHTAGGNASSISYPSNPQFSISVPSTTNITLVLETEIPELAVHVKMLWAGGVRVSSLTAKDILCDSGDYRRGCAFVEVQSVPAGRYTIVCSTFEVGQIGTFTLHVESTAACNIVPLAHETAGRLILRPPRLWLSAGVNRMLAPLTVSRLTRLGVVAHNITAAMSSGSSKARNPLRISLEQSQGPHKIIIGESSEGLFRDVPSGIRIPDADVNPSMAALGGIWLVVERFGGERTVEDECIGIEIWSDFPVVLGAWGRGTG